MAVKNVKDPSNNFSCLLCPYTALQSSSLNRHVKEVHAQITEKHVCKDCGLSFMKEVDFDRHNKSVHLKVKKRISCQFCPFKTRHSEKLRSHVKSVHLEIKDHVCKACGAAFEQKVKLKKHIETFHLRQKNCRLCSYKAASYIHLHEHIKAVHSKVTDTECKVGLKFKKINVNCTLCSYKTVTPTDLDEHVRTAHDAKMKRYACEECGATFEDEAKMLLHFESLHSKLKKHLCQFCTFKAATSTDLKDHIKEHVYAAHRRPKEPLSKEIEAVKKDHEKSIPVKDSQEKCAEKSYVNILKLRNDVISHQTEVMSHHSTKQKLPNNEKAVHSILMQIQLDKTPQNTMGISKDEKSTQSKNKIDIKEKEFYCNVCQGMLRCFCLKKPKQVINPSKVTSTVKKAVLNNHAKIDERSKKHECKECGATFSKATTMIKHLKLSHIKIKQPSSKQLRANNYKCEKCDQAFPKRTLLVIHKRDEHNDGLHVCKKCGLPFFMPWNLAEHVRTVHTGALPNLVHNSLVCWNMIDKLRNNGFK